MIFPALTLGPIVEALSPDAAPSSLGVAVLVLTLVFGFGYPVSFTGFAQARLPDKANGSLVERDGKVVGSRLAAQAFTKPQYFHPRPSATAPEYNAAATTFANLGPTNPDLAKAVRERAPRSWSSRAHTTPACDRRHPRRRRHDLRVGHRPAHLACQRRLQATRVADVRELTLAPRAPADRRQHGRPLARHLRRARRERPRAEPRTRRGDRHVTRPSTNHLHPRDRLRGDRRLVPQARPADAVPQSRSSSSSSSAA